jgi:hypothetical protein
MFLAGCLTSIRLNIGYVFLAELVGAKYRTFYGTLLMMI